MADFHEYYNGARRAPYLTIFIGGNHEASNHLFELYFGGWVAPNIYYMGAANIMRLGPLRIAGLSGIWKGYDYRKPHFERVPYNEAESVSIFHVRELDVRKVLAVRNQVDIGLSHDWPQGVEWKGDYHSLFRKKDRFETDASEGKLGSIAARQCLDRLRPSHWFSAHLHIKYAALVRHGDYEWVRPERESKARHGARLVEPTTSGARPQQENEAPSKFSNNYTNSSFLDDHQDQRSSTNDKSAPDKMSLPTSLATASHNHKAISTPKPPERAQVSAWQNFHVEATKAEAQDTELRLREQRERTADEEHTGIRSGPQYFFDETWKQVRVDDSVQRGIASVSKSTRAPGDDAKMANIDGCVESKLKRSRPISSDGATPSPSFKNALSGQLDGQALTTTNAGASAIKNVDEIEIDVSDSSSDDAGVEGKLARSNSAKAVVADVTDDVLTQAAPRNPNKRAKSEAMMSDDSDEGGVTLDPTSRPFVPKAKAEIEANLGGAQVEEEVIPTSETTEVDQEKVSDVMRAQLAELSSSFAPISDQQPVSASLPLPKGIANKTTQFLALDKCERGRDFLQLLEVAAISEQSCRSEGPPYKLQYDKEWLAILRVFAPELELGGNANEKVPAHKGDTYYRERIIEEEEWIEKHVVRAGKLTVPENFSITASVYDADESVATSDSPREYTNPQTSAFCELIDIDNKFDASEEEREARMTRGPRPDQRSFSHNDRGGGRGGRGRGRGGFNGVRGGRGGGRGGRGRGRARW